MRVLFFGMTGQFSVPPLETLLGADVDVCGVVVPAAQVEAGQPPRRLEPPVAAVSDLPLVEPYIERTIIHLAWSGHVPVWEINTPADPFTLALLADFKPDIIAVACFPYIFPSELLQLPRHGCLNLHPSLLPAYRGPEPLFWIARHDERVTGVTLHFLDTGVDSGDIVAQSRFDRPDGLPGAALEQRCAAEGATLLLRAVQQLQHGPLAGHPQNEAKAGYFPRPGRDDFVIPTTWPARRAFNFLRGAEGWPLVIATGDAQFSIRVAISYSIKHTLNQPYLILGDELWMQFEPGVLRAKI